MSDLGAGFGYLIKGQRWAFGHGRWFGFGLLPALITLVVYAGALVGLGYGADDFAYWVTLFADDWSSPWQGLLRNTLVVLVFVLGLFLAVVTFTAVTLLVGQPFYESLSEEVDRSEGGDVPESGLPSGASSGSPPATPSASCCASRSTGCCSSPSGSSPSSGRP